MKIESIPTLSNLKLECYNAFEDKAVDKLPEDVDIYITDNTKKKFISKIQRDAQLEAVTAVGYFCKVTFIIIYKCLFHIKT